MGSLRTSLQTTESLSSTTFILILEYICNIRIYGNCIVNITIHVHVYG